MGNGSYNVSFRAQTTNIQQPRPSTPQKYPHAPLRFFPGSFGDPGATATSECSTPQKFSPPNPTGPTPTGNLIVGHFEGHCPLLGPPRAAAAGAPSVGGGVAALEHLHAHIHACGHTLMRVRPYGCNREALVVHIWVQPRSARRSARTSASSHIHACGHTLCACTWGATEKRS